MTSGTDVQTALQLSTQTAQMMADPDLTGDALLFCLGLLNVIAEDRLSGRLSKRKRSSQFERIGATTGLTAFGMKHIIGNDVPRYEIPGTMSRIGCAAPMIRRDGTCGKPVSNYWADRDPLTGDGSMVGYCTRHRNPGAERARSDRHQQWVINGKPTPPANTGGVLPRYFNTNWERMYHWAAPWRTPDAAPEPTPPRPRFVLIQGGEC